MKLIKQAIFPSKQYVILALIGIYVVNMCGLLKETIHLGTMLMKHQGKKGQS